MTLLLAVCLSEVNTKDITRDGEEFGAFSVPDVLVRADSPPWIV